MTKKPAAKTKTLPTRKGFAYCLFLFQDKIYLLLADDGQGAIIRGWETVAEAILTFEDLYKDVRYLNLTAAGSAQVYQMTFQPSICWARNAKWLQKNVISENREILQIGKTWRYLVGETQAGALAFWMQGEKPKFFVE